MYCTVCHAHTNPITGRIPHSVHCPVVEHDTEVVNREVDHAAYAAYWASREGSRA